VAVNIHSIQEQHVNVNIQVERTAKSLTRVLPGAAILTLLVNLLGYFHHRQWYRSLLGVLGPIAILLILNFWFATYWRSDAIYAALGLMVAVSIWDIFWPANRRCQDVGTSGPGHSPVTRQES
jgi:hypothetical protein